MNILFVCTGNIFRSMSAEYCLKKYVKENAIDGIKCESAGIKALPQKATKATIDTLSEYDIDISEHKQRKITQEIIDGSDLIIAMAPSHVDYIKKNFGIDVPLFNEICFGKKLSVDDVDDVIDDYDNHPTERDDFISRTIRYIHDSISKLIENLDDFQN